MPLPAAIQNDILAVSRISSIPTILKAAAELTGMRVAVVARVTADSWTACAVHDRMGFGLEVGMELDVATTLCRDVCAGDKPIIISHASADPTYGAHRTPKLYQIESYVAIPLKRANGEMFGTLCALDREPVRIEPKVVAALSLFTELISHQLRTEDDHAELQRVLADERRRSRLREEFIAVLGHDLRTPLGSITTATDLIAEIGGLDPVQAETLQNMQVSCRQMSALVGDMLDFARGRLGSGMVVHRFPVADLGVIVRQVLTELRAVHRGRAISLHAGEAIPGQIDEVRFHQLMTNLIGNALQHSPATEPVEVTLSFFTGFARIAIRNGGPPIPREIAANLFTPFQRSLHPDGRKRQGLGLGLYISSEIARAHGGSVEAQSGVEGTVFTVLLPGT